jgi:hypothetical protein
MKKLALNRETLSVLSSMQEQQINGGISRATQCNSKDIRCDQSNNCTATICGGGNSGAGVGTCGCNPGDVTYGCTNGGTNFCATQVPTC